MRSVSLSVKLVGGFIVVALITLGVGYVGWNGVGSLDKDLKAISQESLPSIQNLLVIQKNLESLRAAQNGLLNQAFDAAKRRELLEQVAKAREGYQKAWQAYEGIPKNAEEAKLTEQLKQNIDLWRQENNVFFQLTQELDKTAEVTTKAEVFSKMNTQLIQKCLPQQVAALALMDRLIGMKEGQTAALTKDSQVAAERAKFLSGTGMVVGFGLALALGIILSMSITRPINRVITGLNEGADQVEAASAEVSAASQSLAQGSSEQAASLEETSSSLEEMASMTRQNADHASEADALMQETGRVVQEADRYMNDLTTSMQEISQASDETAKIIKTIDEIAFQTNLLALNAAVEAARAGEAGAGFAVVADEVRNLAMRAAEAAKNTANLIEGTVGKVKGGTELVARTAEAFGQVTTSSGKVQELVAEIAAASREQAQGAEQVSRAVAEMDKVVQSNAANAEESASASEELSAQAVQMKGVVGNLVALVEGRAQNGQSQHRRLDTGQGRSRARQTLPVVKRRPAPTAPAKGGARVVTPEQVIPLEEGEFKDF